MPDVMSPDALAHPAPDAPPSAFDDLAGSYDQDFTGSVIGRALRAAVWRRLAVRFQSGDRVLELNCGTGADAMFLAQRGVQVLATDVTRAMLAAAQARVIEAGAGQRVTVQRLDLQALAAWGDGVPAAEVEALLFSHVRPFTGVLSNFGGLNCIANLAGAARALARVTTPGAWTLLCIMGPLVPWEWAWYLGRGEPGKAFRRLRRRGVAWRGLTIHYPSIGAVRRAFAPSFELARVSAVGALLPPTYAEPWAARHPRLVTALTHAERRLETLFPLPWLADHFLLELRRR